MPIIRFRKKGRFAALEMYASEAIVHRKRFLREAAG